MREIETLKDLEADLASRHRALTVAAPMDAQATADLRTLQRDGYVVLEGLLDVPALDAIRTTAQELIGQTGRNRFEGHLTQRVYNVLGKTRVADRLAEHPRVLALLDAMMTPNYLLSQAQVINILAGEAAQLIHYDDLFYRAPRPRPPLGMATVFAIDDFTETNGATLVVPGSHLWDAERAPAPGEAIPVVMPAGSAVLFQGTLWHGGGANSSPAPRLAFTCQYCEPWLRQQENFLLEIPTETARQLSERLLSLIGYSIHPPFMGMVDGKHPRRILEQT